MAEGQRAFRDLGGQRTPPYDTISSTVAKGMHQTAIDQDVMQSVTDENKARAAASETAESARKKDQAAYEKQYHEKYGQIQKLEHSQKRVKGRKWDPSMPLNK